MAKDYLITQELVERGEFLKTAVTETAYELLRFDPAIRKMILYGSYAAFLRGRERDFVHKFSKNSDAELFIEPGQPLLTSEQTNRYLESLRS